MIENIRHDPERNDDPESYREFTGLTAEQREDRLNFAQSLKSIYIYKVDNGKQVIDIEATKQQRERFIKDKGLEDTASYSKNFEIVDDEQGLPIFRLKI